MISEKSTTQAAQEFHDSFVIEKNSILTILNENDTQSTSIIKNKLVALSQKVTDATIYLPTYDQMQYLKFIKETQVKLNSLEPAKKKFSFKKKEKSSVSIASTPEIVSTPQTSTPQAESINSLQIIKNQTITFDDPSQTDLTLKDYDHCIIQIQCNLTSLFLNNLSNCIVTGVFVKGSILIQNIQNSILVMASRQLRCHNSTNLVLFTHTNSNPIIEDCTQMKFIQPLFDSNRLKEVELDVDNNPFNQVQDFNWHRNTPSPNWSSSPNPPISIINELCDGLTIDTLPTVFQQYSLS
ncbi:tubulin binding cofactor C-domain-containing protein [Globomyces pollinis-pini]|nr:tubulin binding cofactor C-domain-containing protein [Globomyces pollinis-pini]